jgi:DNA primase
MFPILGPGGRTLGFGARSLDGSEPKYLNTPETAVYHKREVLYGLEAARALLARRGTAWIVEGYMDVLALHQAGFGEAVSVSGTALTDRHALLLRRHVPRVVLLFDGDEAGRAAILRSLPPLLQVGLEVTVALLPAGEDPDSLARRGGPEAVRGLVGGATSVVSFTIAHFHGSLGKREARAEALRHLVQLGSLVPDGVSRRLFAEEGSRRLGFDEATLAREIEAGRAGASAGHPSGRAPAASPSSPAPRSATRGYPAERQLLAFALGRPWVVKRIRSDLPPTAVRDLDLRRLLLLILERDSMNQSIRPADLIEPDMDPELGSLVTALAVDPATQEAEATDVEPLIAQLRARLKGEERARIRELIREHEAAGHEAEVRELVSKLADLMQAE